MNDTDQYRRLQPKVLPDATMFPLPRGHWVAAQLVDELGSWEVVYFGHLWAEVIDYGMTRLDATLLAFDEHGRRLDELEAS